MRSGTAPCQWNLDPARATGKRRASASGRTQRADTRDNFGRFNRRIGLRLPRDDDDHRPCFAPAILLPVRPAATTTTAALRTTWRCWARPRLPGGARSAFSPAPARSRCSAAAAGPADVGSAAASEASSGSTTTPATTSPATGTTTASASCTSSRKRPAGPYPADGSNTANGAVANALMLSGIVRSDIRSSIAGATGVAAGVPLTVTIELRQHERHLRRPCRLCRLPLALRPRGPATRCIPRA